MDWRLHFQKSPLTMMGVAVGAGVLLAAMTAKPSRRRQGNGAAFSKSTRAWRC